MIRLGMKGMLCQLERYYPVVFFQCSNCVTGNTETAFT